MARQTPTEDEVQAEVRTLMSEMTTPPYMVPHIGQGATTTRFSATEWLTSLGYVVRRGGIRVRSVSRPKVGPTGNVCALDRRGTGSRTTGSRWRSPPYPLRSVSGPSSPLFLTDRLLGLHTRCTARRCTLLPLLSVRYGGARGQLTVRADSGFYTHAVAAVCRRPPVPNWPSSPPTAITASAPTGTERPWTWKPTTAATPRSRTRYETSSTAWG